MSYVEGCHSRTFIYIQRTVCPTLWCMACHISYCVTVRYTYRTFAAAWSRLWTSSCCTIHTSPTNCSDDSWRDIFFGKHEHGLCDFWYAGAIERHLLTYLITVHILHGSLMLCTIYIMSDCAMYAVAILSVCPSVCDKTQSSSVSISTPYETGIALVFPLQRGLLAIVPFHPRRSPKVTHPLRKTPTSTGSSPSLPFDCTPFTTFSYNNKGQKYR